MKRQHAITSAQWIWPEGYLYLHNHFAQFRRDFNLSAAPAKAILHLTADKSYKLYVNGTFVCRGPARGYQSHWPFDSVDLRPYLQKEHNWISVEAYNPGISTFQYLHLTRAGFSIPSAAGNIHAKWTRTDVSVKGELKLPKKVRAQIMIPGQKSAKASGNYRFSLTLPITSPLPSA